MKINSASTQYLNQCYKYPVDKYIAKGPKRNYLNYRRKCRQMLSIYQQNKKYKNHNTFENIGKYRHKIGKYCEKSTNIAKNREKIGKNRQKNRAKYQGDILSIYRQRVNIAIYHNVADISAMFVTLV